MKICLLGNNGSVHIQKWVKALSQSGEIDLHVITFNKGVKFERVRYYYLKPYFKNKIDYLVNIIFLRKLIREINPDIVHSHYATSYGFMGALLNFHPYLITGWGADIFDSPKNFLLRFILKYSLRRADEITVLSNITRKEIAKLTNKKIEVIPFGVDTEKFIKLHEGIDDVIKIGTIRTLSEKYGVEYLIRAFGLLHDKYKNIYLEIVGDGELKEHFIRLTKELKISDRVTFHGFVSQTADFEKYISILRSLDIFAILSILDSETFGVAAVEASSCSIPVVATNIGGLPEVVEHNYNGLLVPVRDFENTSKALEKLILDSTLRKTLGENGRKKAMQTYNWKNNVNHMIGLYKQLIKK